MHRRSIATVTWAALLVLTAVLPAPAQAAKNSGLGRFVFIASGAPGIIRVAEFDGTNVVTSANMGFNAPQWGPKGSIVAESDTGIRYIKKMKPGVQGKPIPNTDSANTFPSLSPDGKRVVMFDPFDGIIIVNRRSGKRRTLVPIDNINNQIARFDPSGRFVYFTTFEKQIARIRVTGGQPVVLTSATDGCPCRQPDVKGKTFVMKRDPAGAITKPVDPPLNTSTTVIDDDADTPVFSPTGRYIAFRDVTTIVFKPADGTGSRVTTSLLSQSIFDWGK